MLHLLSVVHLIGMDISKGYDRLKPDELIGSRSVLRGAVAEMLGSSHPYIKVKGQWKYFYLAVYEEGNTVLSAYSKAG